MQERGSSVQAVFEALRHTPPAANDTSTENAPGAAAAGEGVSEADTDTAGKDDSDATSPRSDSTASADSLLPDVSSGGDSLPGSPGTEPVSPESSVEAADPAASHQDGSQGEHDDGSTQPEQGDSEVCSARHEAVCVGQASVMDHERVNHSRTRSVRMPLQRATALLSQMAPCLLKPQRVISKAMVHVLWKALFL